MSLKRKDLLSLAPLSVEEIKLILETADSFKEVTGREIKKVPALRGRTVVNLFFEPSTRTRTSFELAAKRLSADVINFTPSSSSVVKGEIRRRISQEDTHRVRQTGTVSAKTTRSVQAWSSNSSMSSRNGVAPRLRTRIVPVHNWSGPGRPAVTVTAAGSQPASSDVPAMRC